MHDTPIPIDERRFERDDNQSSTSSHSHRLHLHRKGRDKDRDRDKGLDKELPPRPSSAHKESMSLHGLTGHDYRKGLRLHMDGTASSHSSQTRLARPGSPTPSIASSLSGNPPKSPGENLTKSKSSLWGKLWGKEKDGQGDSEKEGSQQSRGKGSKGKPSEPITVTASGISPVHVTPKRPFNASGSEFVNPRSLEYAPVEAVQWKRLRPPGSQNAKRGMSYEGPESRRENARNRMGRGPKDPEKQGTEFQLDTDFSNLHDIVKAPGALSAEPGPGTSFLWENQEKTPPVGADITWKPPESWDSVNPGEIAEKSGEEEGDEVEDAQVFTFRITRLARQASDCSRLLVLHTGVSGGFNIRNTIMQAASNRHGGVVFTRP